MKSSKGRSNRSENLLDMVVEIDTCAEGLNEWEINFIASLIDNPPAEITSAQEYHIKRIYKQRMP